MLWELNAIFLRVGKAHLYSSRLKSVSCLCPRRQHGALLLRIDGACELPAAGCLRDYCNSFALSTLAPRVPYFAVPYRYYSELFLERFAAQAFGHAEKLGRRTIKYQDVSDVRVKDENLLFLEAVVPP